MPSDEGTPAADAGVARLELRASPAASLRLLAAGCLALGSVVLVQTVLAGVDAPSWLVTAVTLLAVPAAALIVWAVVRLAGGGPRLVVDDAGFDNRTSVGVGERRGAWKVVEEVRVERGLVVLLLAEGKRSVLNPAPLGLSADDLASTVRGYLARPFG